MSLGSSLKSELHHVLHVAHGIICDFKNFEWRVTRITFLHILAGS
jgi:hypothetical protein